MTASSSTQHVLEAAGIRLDAAQSPDDVASIVATLALAALSDEVLTASERGAFVETLEHHFAIRIAPEGVCDVLARTAASPRHALLREVAERCRTWPRDRAQALMSAVMEIVQADGVLAAGEQFMLQRIALALGCPEPDDAQAPRRDPTVLSQVILTEGDELRIGRSIAAEICLPRAPIAPHQVRLVARGDRAFFENIGDARLVTFKGRPVASGELAPGEELALGRYRIRLEARGRVVSIVHPGFGTTLEVADVTTTVRQGRRLRQVVDGVSFRVAAGELVGIVGPSGSGKSTLLHVLRGDLRASKGSVTLDGIQVAPGVAAAIRRIAFVPQEDLLLAQLTVEEALSYTATLKGLGATGRSGFAGSFVDEMLERVGLSGADVRRTRIGDAVHRGISGGQRRRVSVAQELVGDDTDVLLLDEPTSGLDPKSEASVASLMRELADGGKIVIAATHAVHADSLGAFDWILGLDSLGRAAYFGPPAGLLPHFGARDISAVFEILDRGVRSDSWRSEPPHGLDRERPEPHVYARSGPPLGPIGQLGALLRREATVRSRDPVTLGLTLALPIAVASLCSLVYYRGCIQPTLLFVFTLTSVWAGVSFTVRDIISNFAVMRHESRTRAGLAMSYGAKALVALGASGLQALLLASSLFLLLGARDARHYAGWGELVDHASLMNPLSAFVVLWACHFFGNAVGVVLSASFRTTEAAIFMVPFVLLPLVAFSGALVPPKDTPAQLAKLMRMAPLYQGYVGLLGSSANVCFHAPVDVDDPRKSDRSVVCDADHRTVAGPGPEGARAAFVQSEPSCLNNVYQYAGDYCHDNALPCHPGSSADPIGAQLNPGLVATSAGTLVGFSSLLYLAALQVSKRRMRTL